MRRFTNPEIDFRFVQFFLLHPVYKEIAISINISIISKDDEHICMALTIVAVRLNKNNLNDVRVN